MSQPAPPILVVDDDPDLLLMLATALELDGRRVVTATNGVEALQQAERHRPSLIVLDLMLPIVSGEAFRETQLADAAFRSIPVLVVSARHDAEDVAARMKAIGYLSKPLSLETFIGLVNATLPERQTDERQG